MKLFTWFDRVRKLFNRGVYYHFLFGVAGSNRPKGRGIRPPLRIKERGRLREAAQAVLKSLPLKIKKFVLDMKNSFDFEEYKEFQALL
ncbi:MAG: hypothetical protein LBC27_07680, partial [Spirochaetaceae bacterium]|nr:hypothetical protein [Spirochaetaceae bacterium]